MFGKNKQSSPPPIRRTATMNVGAGQYKSSNVAITMLPTMPPKRAATIDIATPVALKQRWNILKYYMLFLSGDG